MGGAITAFFGGLHYWWPKIVGRTYNEKSALVAIVTLFIGLNLTFFPQFVAGARGMPRRYEYVPEYELWNQLSTMGAFLFGLSLFGILGYLLMSLINGRKAPANPWGGVSLEWETASPPIEHNFATPPVATRGPYDFDEIVPNPSASH